MKGRRILRIVVSTLDELPFVKMSLSEAKSVIDEVVLVEADTTHTGQSKNLVYVDLAKDLREIHPHTTYVPLVRDGRFRRDAESSADVHWNELLIRGAWATEFRLSPADIVLAVDADEIFARSAIRRLIARSRLRRRSLNLGMHQLFFRPNNLWTDAEFSGPSLVRARDVRQPVFSWRNFGEPYRRVQGFHFSWCMPVSSMLAKISMYSHNPEFKEFSDPEALRKARDENRYIFDPVRSYTTRRLSISDMESLFPASFWNYCDELDSEVFQR